MSKANDEAYRRYGDRVDLLPDSGQLAKLMREAFEAGAAWAGTNNQCPEPVHVVADAWEQGRRAGYTQAMRESKTGEEEHPANPFGSPIPKELLDGNIGHPP